MVAIQESCQARPTHCSLVRKRTGERTATAPRLLLLRSTDFHANIVLSLPVLFLPIC